MEVGAMEEEAQALRQSLEALLAASLRSLTAVEDAGMRFTAQWRGSLERTVESAEARYRLGEGTLTELLDSRKARLAALGDFERWRAEQLSWRARVARFSGAPMDPGSLCSASPDLQSPIPVLTNNFQEENR
jgi:hypothetical protein